jgi:hypothetical protein
MKKSAKKTTGKQRKPFSWTIRVNRRKNGPAKLPSGCGGCGK